jgi:hypothetical protein
MSEEQFIATNVDRDLGFPAQNVRVLLRRIAPDLLPPFKIYKVRDSKKKFKKTN